MSRNTNGRLSGAVARIAPWRIAGLILILFGASHPAQAQFGGLKRLKKALSQPDSVVQPTDSTAQPAAVLADSNKPKRSFFSRAAAAAGSASDKMEKVTGISAKDAALAASGVGVAGLIAKKAGLPDAGSLVGNALNNPCGGGLQHRLGGIVAGMPAAVTGSVTGAIPASIMAAASGPSAAALQTAMTSNSGLSSAGLGTPADAAAMLAFQLAMMQTATAASSGDASARARLDAWQAIALKYQAQAAELTASAAAGNTTAVRHLQEMQLAMINEWIGAQNLHTRVAKP